MRQGSALIVCLMMITLLCAAPVFADRNTEDLQSKIIERFDTSDGAGDVEKYDYVQNHRWIVRGSKFVTEGFPKYNLVSAYPQALFPNAAENAQYNALGIQAAFDRRGYNYLELIPVEQANDAQGNPVETGISLPGRVKNIDMWVWGSNYNYYLDIHVRDWRGMVHVLRMGDLNFKGWKNLKIEIPGSIPQDVIYVPNRQGLELVKMVLWTRPEEKVDGFYVYFDHIKTITDMFETPFDGSSLADPATVQKLWSTANPQTN